ncbi:BgTH12-06783 [Blumeria graminis f. sp. triticale]|uniref:non-specific serine/threonine protein kinase n=1 Tax=Blumeria graminis f. sp. triticale TaxID=1689686 RepID=A0A9W4GCZ9_BLUGR|nr:BgTH12-06783 [Blumeria graminis f. sp. triticale]
MDQYEEFFEYTTRNPLNQILAHCRSSLNNQLGSIRDVKFILNDLQVHIMGYLQFTESYAITSLVGNLLNLQSKIYKEEIPLCEFERLIYLVKFGSDRDIWYHTMQISDILTREAAPILPDLQIPLTRERRSTTTILRSVSETIGYDDTRGSLIEALKAKLTGYTYKCVDKFWERYRDEGQCGNSHVFSENMDEKAMIRWFKSFYKTYLKPLKAPQSSLHENPLFQNPYGTFVRGKFSFTSCTSQLLGGRSPRKMDVFIEHSDIPKDWFHKWEDVRVIGEVTKSAEKKKEKFYQLTMYVREIFYAQPLRRFVHGFCLHKRQILLWIIDRSGAYSSSAFNVIADQEKLVRALSSYMLMSDEELGLDTTIRQYNGRSFVKIRDGDLTLERWVEINPVPVTRPETVMARGNTCYLTMDMMYLIKFSWGSGAIQSEIDFLKCARPVYGVVDLVWAEEIYQVQAHRAGLDFSTGKRWDIGQRNWLSIGSGEIPEEYFKKRKLTLAVLSPYGRPFKSCTSLWEFVSGMLDAILGHRNLYLSKNILHGDISESNIILTHPNEYSLSKGKLIDLDMSINVAGYNETKSLTGTMKFMAIRILKNLALKKSTIIKTYRHDLESFFYVFLVGCVCYGRDTNSHEKHFDNWCSSIPIINQALKMGDVSENFQERIIDEFSPCFNGLKGLAFELRHIIFRNDGNFFDTPRDSAVLYEPIIAAFLNTIEKINSKYFFHSYQTNVPLEL